MADRRLTEAEEYERRHYRDDNYGSGAYRGIQNVDVERRRTDWEKEQAEQERESEEFEKNKRSHNVKRVARQLRNVSRGRKLTKKLLGKRVGNLRGVGAVRTMAVMGRFSIVGWLFFFLYIVQLMGSLVGAFGLAVYILGFEVGSLGLLERVGAAAVSSGLFGLVGAIAGALLVVAPENVSEHVVGVGLGIFAGGWVVVVLCGGIMLLITALILITGRVHLRGGVQMIGLSVAIAGYVFPIPLVNGLPWGLVWVIAVVIANLRKAKNKKSGLGL